MLYERFFSDLPMLQGDVFKKVNPVDKTSTFTFERVVEIETDDSGKVIRLRVEHVEFIPDGNGKEMIKYTHRDYTSRSWITRVMREYAHIAAKNLTHALIS